MTTSSRDQRRVSETDWLRTVGDTLDLTGWAWIHHRPARRSNGKWVTANVFGILNTETAEWLGNYPSTGERGDL